MLRDDCVIIPMQAYVATEALCYTLNLVPLYSWSLRDTCVPRPMEPYASQCLEELIQTSFFVFERIKTEETRNIVQISAVLFKEKKQSQIGEKQLY